MPSQRSKWPSPKRRILNKSATLPILLELSCEFSILSTSREGGQGRAKGSSHFNVSFEAEWIANSTKQTGPPNFGFQLARASQSSLV
jgi:hypothetical protein